MHIAQQIKNNLLLTIGVLVFILIGIIMLITRFGNTPSINPPENKSENKKLKYTNIDTVVETSSLPENQGIDINAEPIQKSIQEIQKIAHALPYTKQVKTTDGRTIEIVIPAMDIADNNWTLLVQIFGIDYQVPKDSDDYDIEQQAFLEGFAHVTQFFTENGIDSSKIIIIWGDREFLHTRAQMWLEQ